MRRKIVTAVAAGLLAALPGVAMAAPAGSLAKKPPPFHAMLSYGPEKLTIAGSIDTFSTKGTATPKGDRIVSWTASFGDHSKIVKGKGLPKTITHRSAKAARVTVVFTVPDLRGKRTAYKLGRAVWGGYAKPRAFLALPTVTTGHFEPGEQVTVNAYGYAWNNVAAAVTVDFGDGTTQAVPYKAHPGEFLPVTHTYTTASLFPITATATDNRHGVGTALKYLLVSDAPTTKFATTGQAEAGKAYEIDTTQYAGGAAYPGLGTFSAPGAIFTERGVGGDAVHGLFADYFVTWATGGTKTVTMTETDSRQRVHVDSYSLTVFSALSVTLTGGLGSTQLDSSFDPVAGVPFTDAEALDGLTVTSWSLDPGDGTGDFDGSGAFPSGDGFEYDTPGVYSAVLTLRLSDGTQIVSNAATADVADPPTLTMQTTATITAGQGLSLSVSAALGARGAWAGSSADWGDGTGEVDSVGTPPTSVSHTYSAPGSYNATFEVDDDHGGFDTAEVAVTVTP